MTPDTPPVRRGRLTDAERHARTFTEKHLTERIRQLVKKYDGMRYHTFNSQFSPSGFPDETILVGGRLLFAELKKELGKVTTEQETWLNELTFVGAECYLWKPSDLLSGEVEAILRDGPSLTHLSRWIAPLAVA